MVAEGLSPTVYSLTVHEAPSLCWKSLRDALNDRELCTMPTYGKLSATESMSEWDAREEGTLSHEVQCCRSAYESCNLNSSKGKALGWYGEEDSLDTKAHGHA